jgi:glycine/D-amino acid oxidase-like deaminating enzyme
MRKVDFLLVGQGIAGTFLSYFLQEAGYEVIVIDQFNPNSATQVASGVINPVTGRQVVTTWLADEVLPFAWDAYQRMGAAIGQQVIEQSNILAFPPSEQMLQGYQQKIQEANAYVRSTEDVYQNYFHYRHGVVEIAPAYLIDLHVLLKGWRDYLRKNNSLIEESFDEAALQTADDGIIYSATICAKHIIYCNGIQAYQSAYWQHLPHSMNKGEALIAAIPDLPTHRIYKFGITTLVPWDDGQWWVGSSYDNRFTDDQPSALFRARKEAELQQILKLPYQIVDHIASIRPATVERRPFVGLHPQHARVGIFGGMGTKGCSLSPYFAKAFADYFQYQTPIHPAAAIQRFQKILSR